MDGFQNRRPSYRPVRVTNLPSYPPDHVLISYRFHNMNVTISSRDPGDAFHGQHPTQGPCGSLPQTHLSELRIRTHAHTTTWKLSPNLLMSVIHLTKIPHRHAYSTVSKVWVCGVFLHPTNILIKNHSSITQ